MKKLEIVKLFPFLSANPDLANRSYSKEREDPNRTKFDRDRDRILFSKEFRRLMGKTQVFVASFDDHIRNRLTHTLEVSQIAQSISKRFGFNLTLTEAIALGHDVGHTPFGHVGERLLNLITNNCDTYKDFKIDSRSHKGFKHNWQGIKVASTLEKISPKYKGLNLTDYTLWGIVNHSNLEYKKCDYFSVKQIPTDLSNPEIKKEEKKCSYRHNNEACKNDSDDFSLDYYNKYKRYIHENSWTFEALVVRMADEIAQRHHDIEDGLIARIIDRKELVDTFVELFGKYLRAPEKNKLSTIKKAENLDVVLHDLSSLILNFYSKHLINNSEEAIKSSLAKYGNVKTSSKFHKIKDDLKLNTDIFKLISYDKDFMDNDKLFQTYLYDRILNSHLAQSMDGKANYILRKIIHAYLANPKQLPNATIVTFFFNFLSEKDYKDLTKGKTNAALAGTLRNEISKLHNQNKNEKYNSLMIRTVVDLIAGMTDSFAIAQYKLLYEGQNIKNN